MTKHQAKMYLQKSMAKNALRKQTALDKAENSIKYGNIIYSIIHSNGTNLIGGVCILTIIFCPLKHRFTVMQ